MISRLTEDGRPQTLKYFARETDLPLTLGMLVDTSMSQRRVLSEERDASESFLAQVLREDQDKAFVIHFDHEVELLQDLTAIPRTVAIRARVPADSGIHAHQQRRRRKRRPGLRRGTRFRPSWRRHSSL